MTQPTKANRLTRSCHCDIADKESRLAKLACCITPQFRARRLAQALALIKAGALTGTRRHSMRYRHWQKTGWLVMPSVTHAGFKIKSITDGSLYRARVERSDGTQLHANGKITNSWESSQSMDAEAAIGQAIYAINTGRVK
jgi:hypothetical protein